MTVELKRFQKADLAWMHFREHLKSAPLRQNGVSADAAGLKEPSSAPVSGGIYANAPGFGKTVTTIALILSNPRRKVWDSCNVAYSDNAFAAFLTCSQLSSPQSLSRSLQTALTNQVDIIFVACSSSSGRVLAARTHVTTWLVSWQT